LTAKSPHLASNEWNDGGAVTAAYLGPTNERSAHSKDQEEGNSESSHDTPEREAQNLRAHIATDAWDRCA
jgi:hypothetical protein